MGRRPKNYYKCVICGGTEEDGCKFYSYLKTYCKECSSENSESYHKKRSNAALERIKEIAKISRRSKQINRKE